MVIDKCFGTNFNHRRLLQVVRDHRSDFVLFKKNYSVLTKSQSKKDKYLVGLNFVLMSP